MFACRSKAYVELAGVRGLLEPGQRGWVESLLNANAGAREMKRCCKHLWWFQASRTAGGEEIDVLRPLGLVRRQVVASAWPSRGRLASLLGRLVLVCMGWSLNGMRSPPSAPPLILLTRASRQGAARQQGCPPSSGAPRARGEARLAKTSRTTGC